MSANDLGFLRGEETVDRTADKFKLHRCCVLGKLVL